MILTLLALAGALFASVAATIPVAVGVEYTGQGKDDLNATPFVTTTDKNAPNVEIFTIHAQVDHDEGEGTVVFVWITPGMDRARAAQAACDEAKCKQQEPDRVELKRLFAEALNDALRLNERGFGHYRVTKCYDPATKNAHYGEFELAGKYAVSIDKRRIYEVGNSSGGKWTSSTDYVLAIRDLALPKVKFGPVDKNNPNVDGLIHAWMKCKEDKLDEFLFVMQLKSGVLSERTTAGQAPR